MTTEPKKGRLIQIKQGDIADLPELKVGEPAITLDTDQFFIGSSSGNKELVTTDNLPTMELPTASDTILGGVKVDNTSILINTEGIISAPKVIATETILGSVKVDGTTITVSPEGTISAVGGGSGGGGGIPIATTTTLGGIIVDSNNFNIESDGKLTPKGSFVSNTRALVDNRIDNASNNNFGYNTSTKAYEKVAVIRNISGTTLNTTVGHIFNANEVIHLHRSDGQLIQFTILSRLATPNFGSNASYTLSSAPSGVFEIMTGAELTTNTIYKISGGNYSFANGYHSTAIGDSVIAGGNASTALGGDTFAEGHRALSTGQFTQAKGVNSASFGEGTIANVYGSVAMGMYNKELTGSSVTTTGQVDLFVVGGGSGTSSRRNVLRVTKSDGIFGTSAWNSTGADYAEYFEWLDGNKNKEDRVGLLVTLDGDKIKLAESNDELLGVISSNPSVVGDAHEDEWINRYERDLLGNLKLDEEGNLIESSLYDNSIAYTPRSKRNEWAVVGLVGKLIVKDDGTAVVNGKVSASTNGIATASNEGFRVMKRVSENIIQILVK